MNKNCVIFGDSWAMGEWHSTLSGILPVPVTRLAHRGIQSYLEHDGYTVTNLSVSGAGNLHIAEQFVNYANNIDLSDTVIIFVQTDPIRDCINNDSKEWWADKQTPSELAQRQTEKLKECYQLLSTVPYTINCIGGCHPLDIEEIKKHSNLKPLLESIMQHLTANTIPTLWRSDNWTNHIHYKFISREMLDYVCEQEELREQLPKQYFWPDGWHPNRQGYKVVYDYIKDLFVV